MKHNAVDTGTQTNLDEIESCSTIQSTTSQASCISGSTASSAFNIDIGKLDLDEDSDDEVFESEETVSDRPPPPCYYEGLVQAGVSLHQQRTVATNTSHVPVDRRNHVRSRRYELWSRIGRAKQREPIIMVDGGTQTDNKSCYVYTGYTSNAFSPYLQTTWI